MEHISECKFASFEDSLRLTTGCVQVILTMTNCLSSGAAVERRDNLSARPFRLSPSKWGTLNGLSHIARLLLCICYCRWRGMFVRFPQMAPQQVKVPNPLASGFSWLDRILLEEGLQQHDRINATSASCNHLVRSKPCDATSSVISPRVDSC